MLPKKKKASFLSFPVLAVTVVYTSKRQYYAATGLIDIQFPFSQTPIWETFFRGCFYFWDERDAFKKGVKGRVSQKKLFFHWTPWP